MLSRIFSGALLVYASTGCKVVECPANMTCTYNTHPNAAGGGGSGGADEGTAGEAGDPDDAGTIVDDGSNGSPELPAGAWKNVTGNLKGKPSGCGNLSGIFVAPGSNALIASILLQGLWTSSAGNKWTALGNGAGSAQISNAATSLLFDPADPKVFWESGIYGDLSGGGAYRTDDGGDTFTALALEFSDSISVDFSDEKRRLLLAGSHEKAQSVFKSTDGGGTWQNVGASLPADQFCSVVLIVSPTTYLVGCSGSHTSIFRTTDGAKHWAEVSAGGGGLRPLLASDGTIYWTTFRNGQLMRSTDDGASWTELVGPDILWDAPPIELPDGRIAVLSKEYVVVSANKGLTWDYASAKLPVTNAGGLAYSPSDKAFFVWPNDCGNVVRDDAVSRFDFDFETQ